MEGFRSQSARLAIAVLFAAFFVTGCSTTGPTMTTGPFAQVSRLEKDLRRGSSTKMDVQRVLGAPKGFGNALFPLDPTLREVWYYDDIEVIGAQSEGEVIRANIRQQIITVFFKDGIFDGFLWFSNAVVATGQ
jgi:outer membrane protein assembly factor BamE (lipoprotein component of BamABCDE complex)